MKILVSWSTGKDSAWMLHLMHAVRRDLLEAQANATGHQLYAVNIPWPCSNAEYERRMSAAIERFISDGFTHVAFGDLFLEDVRRYREDRLRGTGLTPLFPLWRAMPTRQLAREMISGGLRAWLTCVDPRKLDRSFAGRAFDFPLLDDLPADVDPCGENGEFHSFAWDGPMFTSPIRVEPGEVVERDGFVFADIKQPDSAEAITAVHRS